MNAVTAKAGHTAVSNRKQVYSNYFPEYDKLSKDKWLLEKAKKKEETNYFKGVFHFKGFSKQTFSLRKHLQQHIDKKNITGYLINIRQLERPLRS